MFPSVNSITTVRQERSPCFLWIPTEIIRSFNGVGREVEVYVLVVYK